jgi:hypothetical protein
MAAERASSVALWKGIPSSGLVKSRAPACTGEGGESIIYWKKRTGDDDRERNLLVKGRDCKNTFRQHVTLGAFRRRRAIQVVLGSQIAQNGTTLH